MKLFRVPVWVECARDVYVEANTKAQAEKLLDEQLSVTAENDSACAIDDVLTGMGQIISRDDDNETKEVTSGDNYRLFLRRQVEGGE